MEVDPHTPAYPGEIKLSGTVHQQRTQFCWAASAFYRGHGYERAEAWKLACKDWLLSPHRHAMVSCLSESEQIRRRFKKKPEDVE